MEQKLINVLMVAEKPNIARSIARALSNRYSKGVYHTREKKTSPVPIYELEGEIFNKPAFLKITSVLGHIYNVRFEQHFNPWKERDHMRIFGVGTEKQFTSLLTEKVAKNLEVESKKCSYLLLWLDNDREGENISFEVKDICEPQLKKEKFEQVFRVKFSSTADADILRAYDEIKEGPNLNESLSVDARQTLDLKIGVAFSTFQTKYLGQKFEKVNGKLISYGPCQTPTLGFCVKRDDEIKEFKAANFFKIVPKITAGDEETVELGGFNDRFETKEEAMSIAKDIEKAGLATVKEVVQKEHTKGHPEALNTVNLLKIASSEFELGPDEALKVAEKLYLSGFITYPRTETTSYPENCAFDNVIKSLNKVPDFNPFTSYLLKNNITPPKKGKDAGDHPPITPTGKLPNRDMCSDAEWAIYNLVSRHYLATVMPDAKYEKTEAILECGGFEFTLNGTTITNKGFLEVVPWVSLAESKFPKITAGASYKIATVEVKSGKTTAPAHLTESDLLGLMEKNGIGTDASMAGHIQTICERKYVKVQEKSRKLVPTLLGRTLIHCYEKINPDMVAPDLRAKMEKSLNDIAHGVSSREKVEHEVLDAFKEKFRIFTERITEMDSMFEEMVTALDADDFQDRKQHDAEKNKVQSGKGSRPSISDKGVTKKKVADKVSNSKKIKKPVKEPKAAPKKKTKK